MAPSTSKLLLLSLPGLASALQLEWTAVGDSWTSGVAYSGGTVYSDLDYQLCYRSTESWGAQMEKDDTWTDSQKFNFAGCGGSLVGDIRGQLDGRGGTPRMILGTFAGNDAGFGDIARACVYCPWGTDCKTEYKDDKDGTGTCKQRLSAAREFINTKLAGKLSDTLDSIFEFASKPQQNTPDLHVYVSSYAQFFNDKTDDCNDWTFARWFSSNAYPKLVKELRAEMNDLVRLFNSVLEDTVKKYNAPNMLSRYAGFVPIDQVFDKKRFCEEGASFDDQFAGADVWIWNLSWNNGKNEVDDGKEYLNTTTNVKIRTNPSNFDESQNPGTAMSLDASEALRTDKDKDALLHLLQSGFGWTARPFHPKRLGNEAMKNAYIQRARDDKIPGVKGAGGAAAPQPSLYCTNPSLEDGDGICTCNVGTYTTTITPEGGAGNSCPKTISVPATVTFAAQSSTTMVTSTAAPATTMHCFHNPSLEDGDGMCTCTKGTTTTALTPTGGPGAGACPTDF